MSDKIADALGMVPLDAAKIESYDMVPFESSEVAHVVDEQFEQACADFEEVRENMRTLIHESKEMFNEVKDVAVRTQDPDQYNAAARFLELSIRANRELLSTHRDIFAMKPPAPVETQTQQAEQINNIIFQGTTEDLLNMLKERGLRK